MNDWTPTPPPEPFDPYRAPEAILENSFHTEDPENLRPVPFEDLEAEPRFWPRVWAMFGLLFKQPGELFQRIPMTDKLGAPWRFQMLLGIPGMVIMGGFMLLILGSTYATVPETPPLPTGFSKGFFIGLTGGALLLMPLLILLFMLLGGLILHGCLWVWGGLKPGTGLIQSIRVMGYAYAFFNTIAWIPIISSLAALALPAFVGFGLARVHRTDTWRGILACYSPILLCCCLYSIAFAIMIGVSGWKG